ncbi:hypothetical protein [Mycobacterium sp. NPDC006124]|uniref:hypothetical protein n=1 Tax=Mycobacterium sp. NPDC006124 TaxID=3156729 RepID=UPI0033BB5994
MSTTATRRLLSVVMSAAALGAAGFVAMPIARADTCTVNGDYLRLQQNFGPYTTTTTVNAKGSTLGPGAVTVPPSGTNGTYGKASGSVDGRNVDVVITWNDGKGTAHFTGTIGDDGIARGNSTGTPIPVHLWDPGPWNSAEPLVCTGSPTQGGQTATVNKNADVYDAPEGNRLAAPFFLPAGRKLPVLEPCANDWCHLGGIPETGGDGWVYSGEGYLTVS